MNQKNRQILKQAHCICNLWPHCKERNMCASECSPCNKSVPVEQPESGQVSYTRSTPSCEIHQCRNCSEVGQWKEVSLPQDKEEGIEWEKEYDERFSVAIEVGTKTKVVNQDLKQFIREVREDARREVAEEIYDYVNEHIMTMSDLDFKAFEKFIDEL